MVHFAYYVFTAYMRQGLAREACTTIIDHLWHAYDATEIRADSDFRNVPSRCLLESLGFTRRAHTRTTRVHGLPSVDYRYRLKRPGAVSIRTATRNGFARRLTEREAHARRTVPRLGAQIRGEGVARGGRHGGNRHRVIRVVDADAKRLRHA